MNSGGPLFSSLRKSAAWLFSVVAQFHLFPPSPKAPALSPSEYQPISTLRHVNFRKFIAGLLQWDGLPIVFSLISLNLILSGDP